jgi:hypothetical protein
MKLGFFYEIILYFYSLRCKIYRRNWLKTFNICSNGILSNGVDFNWFNNEIFFPWFLINLNALKSDRPSKDSYWIKLETDSNINFLNRWFLRRTNTQRCMSFRMVIYCLKLKLELFAISPLFRHFLASLIVLAKIVWGFYRFLFWCKMRRKFKRTFFPFAD